MGFMTDKPKDKYSIENIFNENTDNANIRRAQKEYKDRNWFNKNSVDKIITEALKIESPDTNKARDRLKKIPNHVLVSMSETEIFDYLFNNTEVKLEDYIHPSKLRPSDNIFIQAIRLLSDKKNEILRGNIELMFNYIDDNTITYSDFKYNIKNILNNFSTSGIKCSRDSKFYEHDGNELTNFKISDLYRKYKGGYIPYILTSDYHNSDDPDFRNRGGNMQLYTQTNQDRTLSEFKDAVNGEYSLFKWRHNGKNSYTEYVQSKSGIKSLMDKYENNEKYRELIINNRDMISKVFIYLKEKYKDDQKRYEIETKIFLEDVLFIQNDIKKQEAKQEESASKFRQFNPHKSYMSSFSGVMDGFNNIVMDDNTSEQVKESLIIGNDFVDNIPQGLKTAIEKNSKAKKIYQEDLERCRNQEKVSCDIRKLKSVYDELYGGRVTFTVIPRNNGLTVSDDDDD